MSIDWLFFYIIQIDDFRLRWRSCESHSRRDFECHHQQSKRRSGAAGKVVRNSRRQVCEIVGANAMRFAAVVQSACALQNEIEFFLSIVGNSPAGAIRIDSNFAEARDSAQDVTVVITISEQGLVVAGWS